MGMDVYGQSPTDPSGEYFRANVWWWRPLWTYCLNNHEDIAGKVEYGFSNDGDGLDSDDARELGERIFADIKDGTAKRYEEAYNSAVASLPMNECDYCNSTGIRTDDVGQAQGMPTEELEPEVAAVVGRTHGRCNGCSGYGKTTPWEANYPFEVATLEEFANFLVSCGGFEIC